jgi:hypothetical protein
MSWQNFSLTVMTAWISQRVSHNDLFGPLALRCFFSFSFTVSLPRPLTILLGISKWELLRSRNKDRLGAHQIGHVDEQPGLPITFFSILAY